MPESISGALVGAERADGDLDATEQQINQLIERRATDKEKANREEESWRESTRVYNGERREMHKHMWTTHYRTLARNLRTSAERFESKANELQEVRA